MLMKKLLLAFMLALFGLQAVAQDVPTLATLRPAHPRLLFTPEVEASLKARLKTDPLLANMVDGVRQRSDALAAMPPVPFESIPYEKFGIQMLTTSRLILERVAAHGLMYRLTRERRYAERLQRDVDTALAYPTWNPAHFLDAGEMLLAVGFAYDWAHDHWTPAQRQAMRTAMKEKGINRGLEIHRTREGLSAAFVTTTSNWNSVGNAGLLAGALAMAEDEREIAAETLRYAIPSLAYPKSSYEPDGGTDEGPTYWGYGTDFYTLAAKMLASAVGSEAGLLDGRGISRTSLFRLHAQGPNGRNYTYADSWPRSGPSVAYAILSQRYGPAAAVAHLRELLADFGPSLGKDLGHRLNPLIVLWLPAAPPQAARGSAPLDAFFGGTAELAMMRSAWGDPDAAYLGFKAGQADHSHNHLDRGSFLFDQAQVRWVADLGPDSYSLPGYFRKESDVNNPLTAANAHLPNRWSYLRNINQGHSTLTLGGDLQARSGVSPFINKGSSLARAFAVADLSTVYPARVTGWQRGVALVDRAWVAVRDELKGLQKDVDVEWGVMTEAKVAEIAADGRSATLTRDGQTLQLRLAQAPAGARISAAPARPRTAAENQNEGITRLTVRWNAGAPDEQLEVHLVPASFKGRALPQGKLADWKP